MAPGDVYSITTLSDYLRITIYSTVRAYVARSALHTALGLHYCRHTAPLSLSYEFEGRTEEEDGKEGPELKKELKKEHTSSLNLIPSFATVHTYKMQMQEQQQQNTCVLLCYSLRL
jgi:hypothetical protein